MNPLTRYQPVKVIGCPNTPPGDMTPHIEIAGKLVHIRRRPNGGWQVTTGPDCATNTNIWFVHPRYSVDVAAADIMHAVMRWFDGDDPPIECDRRILDGVVYRWDDGAWHRSTPRSRIIPA